ncbi:sodium/solute symporter [Cellulosimicrobium sp. NPDC055967]|uniref:sodium:solute symporter family transporter n=1 Tax=Cellulosimicrobium sp. NPDC055967 TaxID=3345670 RepID=UPI0035E18554
MAASDNPLRLDANFIDFGLVAVYFIFVLGIGWLARRQVSSSLDFFLSGRSLPAWVTGLAFISANLGAVEIMGMSANGAQIGVATMHYYWIGAVPAMLFLGVVMMPFYYGSKVRSVPEFMRRRFGTGAHLVNAISFAVAQLLIAGVNLFLLATIVNALLGWPLWVSLVAAAAAVVLTYTALGGLSAAIYNEVLQFFVIVAALLPLTIVGLNRVGGVGGLVDNVEESFGTEMLSSWPGESLTGFDSPVWSVIGIVFGLGFVLSFGYWTTNFVEVQRAMASDSITSARTAPVIGSFPKMLIPFVVVPGIIASVLVPEITALKEGQGDGTVQYNDANLLMIRDLLPTGMLGVALAGLLASFMAGMAANISASNTVFSYDIWQQYVKKDKPDGYYTRVGRIATIVAVLQEMGVPSTDDLAPTPAHAARAFDIRTIIGAVLGIYGVVLLVMGIPGAGETAGHHTDSEVNLWTGAALTAAALSFLLWVRYRPLLVSTGGEARIDPTDWRRRSTALLCPPQRVPM